jgi:hypothetical protein
LGMAQEALVEGLVRQCVAVRLTGPGEQHVRGDAAGFV